MSVTTSADVLTALRCRYRHAAFITELVVNDSERTRRIDALLVIRGQRTAVEVKVSRADYRRETDDKRRMWRAITHRFVYAVPAGLIAPEEVPDGIGLWYVYDRPSGYVNGLWTGPVEVVKRAKVNRDVQPLPDHVVHALCYRATKAP
jgi:hypothetical protein